MSRGTDWMVVCPYFSNNDKSNELVCESPVNGSFAVLRFPSGDAVNAYRKRCCEGDYLNCPIARANEEKYK